MGRYALPLATAAGLWLTATSASAAPPPSEGYHNGGFVYFAPLFVHIPVGDDDVEDVLDPGYQWGLGGGYLFRPTPHFMATVGGAFEHAVANFEGCDPGDCDFRADLLRILPEVRLGGGGDRVFGYGYLQPGLALAVLRITDNVPAFVDDDDTDAGFNLGVGAGVQGLVWKGLFIGGEFGADLAFMTDDEAVRRRTFGADDSYGIHTLEFKAYIGWLF